MKRIVARLLFSIVVLVALRLSAFGHENSGPDDHSNPSRPQNSALKPLYSQLRDLFYQYYPRATSHLVGDKLHFECDTRVFIVHEPFKTGEWQDPWEERGPNRGGILCEIIYEKGPYQGAATVPQTFDKRYYKVLLLAPNAPSADAHLHVRLWYPANVNKDFVERFTAIINNFSRPEKKGSS
jgi:hypothetical protein